MTPSERDYTWKEEQHRLNRLDRGLGPVVYGRGEKTDEPSGLWKVAYRGLAEMKERKVSVATMQKRSKDSGSLSRAKVGKKAKVLTKREARDKGEIGAFALHLASLLKERGIDHAALAKACKRAGLPIEEHAVRAWLRAENMPKSQHLRGIGRALGLDDPRHILPG